MTQPDERASVKVTDEAALAVEAAIREAECPHREGPFGLYDYSAYPGDSPPHQVRDFRDPKDGEYGKTLFYSHSAREAREEYERLTKLHVGHAAVAAVLSAIDVTALNQEIERLRGVLTEVLDLTKRQQLPLTAHLHEIAARAIHSPETVE